MAAVIDFTCPGVGEEDSPAEGEWDTDASSVVSHKQLDLFSA
jgi:hypothetical protein